MNFAWKHSYELKEYDLIIVGVFGRVFHRTFSVKSPDEEICQVLSEWKEEEIIPPPPGPNPLKWVVYRQWATTGLNDPLCACASMEKAEMMIRIGNMIWRDELIEWTWV